MILREAVAADAAAMVELMALPGHFTPADAVAARLGMTGLPTLVADQGGSVFGLCGLTSSTHVDRDAPVGRITIMVVAEKANALVGVGVIAQIARAKTLVTLLARKISSTRRIVRGRTSVRVTRRKSQKSANDDDHPVLACAA